jgi:acetyl-CoA acetyltransferase
VSSRRAVIVSGAERRAGRKDAPAPVELMAEASAEALGAVGLGPRDVDGVAAASVDYYMPTLTLQEYLAISPRFVDSTSLGGCSFLSHLEHATWAIEHGGCETVLIAYGATPRSDPAHAHRLSEPSAYEVPYGVRYPLGGFALMAGQHMHRFGTTPEQLAEVAVNARRWSALTPGAERPDPITVNDVLASPMICTPLHSLDCCLVSNGAVALVLTTESRARDLDVVPVAVAGVASAQSHRHTGRMPDLVTTAGADSGRIAMAQAGIGPGDVDVAQLYDAATITVLLALEDLGFCAKGEGGSFIEATDLGPGGSLPLNTTGAGLANRHLGMLGLDLLNEARLQLQGAAGVRQVPDAKVVLVHALGGVFGATGTAVLTTR